MPRQGTCEDKWDERGYGDVWTWTAPDLETKLICSWIVADRSTDSAIDFMADLRGRIPALVRITADGHLA